MGGSKGRNQKVAPPPLAARSLAEGMWWLHSENAMALDSAGPLAAAAGPPPHPLAPLRLRAQPGILPESGAFPTWLE